MKLANPVKIPAKLDRFFASFDRVFSSGEFFWMGSLEEVTKDPESPAQDPGEPGLTPLGSLVTVGQPLLRG